MKSILIIYIATGYYIEQLYDIFLPNINNFCPQYKKHICILTNKNLENEQFKNLDSNITYDSHYIEFLPWPITTMIKHVYIYKYSLQYPNYDYVCFMNANIKCLNKSQEYWNMFYDDLNNYDILLCNHHECYFLDTENNYVQAGFFIGKYESMQNICYDIGKIECDKLKNRNIPEWHDETIMNEFFHDINNKYNYKQDHYIIHDGYFGDKTNELCDKYNVCVQMCWHKSKYHNKFEINFMDIINKY